MPIDPEAQAVLDDIAARDKDAPQPVNAEEQLAKARSEAAALARFSAPPPTGVSRADLTIPATRRTGPIPVRLYAPLAGRDGPLPLLVWFHGGGTIAGELATHEPVLMALAARTGHAVASVGYTLAPERVFPAQHEECLAAARWLAGKAAALGLDTVGWAIGGDSVGGLYAAATAIALRDADFMPMPAAQVLVYPNTDMRQDRAFASLRENDGRIMTAASLRFEAETAIPDPADRASPRASPLLAADLGRLPAAFIATCGYDPLRDEGEAFAARLSDAGVAVHHRSLPGMIHAVLQMNGRIAVADALMDEIGAFLAQGRAAAR